MTKIENALRVCEIIYSETQEFEKIDILPITYALRNRLAKGEHIGQVASDCAVRKMGDNSSFCVNSASEPCLESLSIAAGVFAGLYEDPTHGATRFHRHDQCPAWSKTLEASALLGPYVYYRE